MKKLSGYASRIGADVIYGGRKYRVEVASEEEWQGWLKRYE